MAGVRELTANISLLPPPLPEWETCRILPPGFPESCAVRSLHRAADPAALSWQYEKWIRPKAFREDALARSGAETIARSNQRAESWHSSFRVPTAHFFAEPFSPLQRLCPQYSHDKAQKVQNSARLQTTKGCKRCARRRCHACTGPVA